jgi:hypothetical protein
MSRALRLMLFVGMVGATAVVASQGLAAGDGKCKRAKGDSPVAKACAEGGIRKAKLVMKDMVKQGKAAGVKTECDDCHKDDANYDVLNEDGQALFEKLLAVYEKKK